MGDLSLFLPSLSLGFEHIFAIGDVSNTPVVKSALRARFEGEFLSMCLDVDAVGLYMLTRACRIRQTPHRDPHQPSADA